MGTSRTSTKKRASKRPPPAARVGAGLWLRVPALGQRELDLLGLALVALGVFLGFVFYLGWSGGTVGGGLADVLRYLVGRIAYGVPLALAAGGAVIVLRPFLPASRPFGSGLVCLFASLTLAFTAGTLGLGPAGAAPNVWARAFVTPRGGVIGEAMYSAAAPAVQSLGAHILAVFLFIAGMLLLTGATVAGVVHAFRTGAVGTGRRLRDSTAEFQAAVARRSAATSATLERRARDPEPMAPPEPGAHDLVVRATHVEAPPLDAAARFPELFGADAAAFGDEDSADGEAPTVRDAHDEPEAGPDPEEPGVTKVVEPPVEPKDLTPRGRYRGSITDDPEFHWRVPDPKLLTRSSAAAAKPDTSGQERTASALLEALGHFGVQARVVGTVAGPHITRYELRLAPGTKVAKVAQLKDDLAYALAATDIRILAPIPGKQAVGVEVPNARRRIVHLGDVFQDPPEDWSPLTVWLGKDVAGRAIGADLAKMPHLLVAGTTGAGKSGAINAMLASVLLRATPHEVRLVLVDPKQVELNHYDSIPHLLTPVITSTRSLIELNRARAKRQEPPLPYVLCVIDELADLMMVAPADVEDSVIRLAQKARAVGIHLVLATQSPRVDVITGMIKANVPSRIAFAVSSQTDSRVILDQNGAESLLGQGDMLFSPVGTSRLQRIQGAYVDEEQIATLTEYWRRQGEPDFHESLLEEVETEGGGEGGGDEDFDPDEDPRLEEAIALVAQMGTASTSMLQRRLRLGYTRAGRLIDMLERRGVISGYEGSKPRQVLIGEGDVPRILAGLSGAGPEVPAQVAAQVAAPREER